jgi:very-short-patch-repair endonuclease
MAVRLAKSQGGVLHRRQLYDAGFTRSQVKAELRARRWRAWGRQTIAVHTGVLDTTATGFRAVFETGADAALDGVSALLAAGLEHFSSEIVHVSVSKSSTYRKPSRVRVHETRRRRPEDVLATNPPRVKIPEAAIRGALWAVSARQAAYILILVAQQGLATPAELQVAFAAIRRDRRRRHLANVLRDIVGGAGSMGELDFARLCRERGIPMPDRQVRRRLPNGRVFLDLYWDSLRLVVEIEGVHHLLPGIAMADSLRQNWLTIEHDKVLRIPALGLQIDPGQFLDQVVAAMRAQGWQPTAPSVA